MANKDKFSQPIKFIFVTPRHLGLLTFRTPLPL